MLPRIFTHTHLWQQTSWYCYETLIIYLRLREERKRSYKFWRRGKLWSRIPCIYGYVKNKVSGGQHKGLFKHLHLSTVQHSCWVILESGIHNKLYNALHFKTRFFFIGDCPVFQISVSRRLEKGRRMSHATRLPRFPQRYAIVTGRKLSNLRSIE